MGNAWILAVRPKTLTAAFVPVAVGSALVIHLGYQLQGWISLLAFLGAGAIQIGTNLFNDALDFFKGADTALRLGPVRVTQSGLLSPRSVLLAALLCYAAALLFGIPLVIAGGWPIVIIGLLSLLCGYLYTGGPYPIAYLGLGEFFVILFFGLVAVGGVVYLQTGAVPMEAFVAGIQIGSLSTIMLAINNLRDVEGDAKAKKKTFAVRFGVGAAKVEIAMLTLFPFLMGAYWLMTGRLLAALLPLLLLPVGFALGWDIKGTPPSRAYNAFLARASFLNLLFALLLSLSLICA